MLQGLPPETGMIYWKIGSPADATQCNGRRGQAEKGGEEKKKKEHRKLEKLEGKGGEEGKLGVGGGPVESRAAQRRYPPRGRRKPPGGPGLPRGMIPVTACLLVYVNISVEKRLF